jgi:hypothetical protein
MRGVVASILALLCAAAAPVNPATAPSCPALRSLESINHLVADLAAEDWQVRQSAQDELVSMGAAVLPRLYEVARDSCDAETRQRAEAAAAQIAEDQLIGPSMVTLDFVEAHPRDVFAELGRQANAELLPVPAELWELRPWGRITVDVQRKPFWAALREISDETGVELRQWNDGMRLLQSAGGHTAGRWTVSGPFLISLNRCGRSQSIDYAQADAVSSEFQLTFTAMAEPKLHVLRAAYLARLDEARDEKGNSLLPTEFAGQVEALEQSFVANSSGVWQFTARLHWVPETGSQLSVLRGAVAALVQTRHETIEVPDVLSAAGITRSSGGVSLTVTDIKKSGERYDLTAVLSRDRAAAAPAPGDGVVWDHIHHAPNDLKLLDDQNRPLLRSRLDTAGAGDSVEVSMTFARQDASGTRVRPGEPFKLVWQIPIETKELSIPFEFHDVPIPR